MKTIAALGKKLWSKSFTAMILLWFYHLFQKMVTRREKSFSIAGVSLRQIFLNWSSLRLKCSCTVVCWGTYSISFINYLGVTDPHNQPCVKTICLPLSPFLLLCKSLYFLITIIICEYFISVIYHLRYAICIYLIYVFNFFLTHL